MYDPSTHKHPFTQTPRAGIHGKFSETVALGSRQSTTFKTHTLRSKVHRALDEL